MKKKEKQYLAEKIIRNTDIEIDDEHFIHRLLDESALYNIYEEEKAFMGQKAADYLARFAGSWFFVILFCLFLALWITANILFLKSPFDPNVI